MKENNEIRSEKIAQLEGAIKELPVKLQDAVYWAIKNYEVLEKMGRRSKMTMEEIQSAMKNALAEESYATLILLYITKYTKENEEL